MKLNNAVKKARKCFKARVYACPGGSGLVQCFFCPGCALSLSERIMNLAEYDVIAIELKTRIKNELSFFW